MIHHQIFTSVRDFTTILVVADIVIIVVKILVVRGEGGSFVYTYL